MKKLIVTLFLLAFLASVTIYRDDIVKYIMQNFIYSKNVTYEKNQYFKDDKFLYVKYTDDFVAKKYQDILNIIYSGLNNGSSEFYFYCDDSYKNCGKDVADLIGNDFILSNVNNFVHPYNSYSKLYITINNYGRVIVDVDKTYSDSDIIALEAKVNSIMNNILKDNMTEREKIKQIHDYIINKSKYDQEKANAILNNSSSKTTYNSHIAIGPLFQGYAICGGYTDAMAIFLNKLGITNYKIASSDHVWNLVKLDNKWYHLDLTWDDPVISTGESTLLHKFFLIDTETLKSIDATQHQYYKDVFLEANQ